MNLFNIITGKQKLIDELENKEHTIHSLKDNIKNLNFIIEEKDIEIKGLTEQVNNYEKEINTIKEKKEAIQEVCSSILLPDDLNIEEYDEDDKYEDIVIKKYEKKKGNPFNQEQLSAIKHSGKHLRIIAGAGSGKTETICSKAVYLTQVEKVHPEKICMITFTKKAAREMKDRVKDISDGSCNKITIGTFNSIFKDISNEMLGLDEFAFLKNFIITGTYNSKDSEENSNKRYNSVLNALIVKYKLKSFQTIEGYIKAKLEYWATMGYSNEKIREIIKNHYEEDKSKSYNKEYISLSERFYKMLCEFDTIRKENSIYLLSDQILNMYKIATYDVDEKELISDYLENKFDYIFIDEFQDTNGMQIDIIKRFVPPHKEKGTKLIIVGDANQAIYMFRGSDSSYIQNFDSIYEGKLDTINLLQNYRSAQDIVLKANNLITYNYKNRKPTYSFEMIPFNKADEKSVFIKKVGSKEDEVKVILKRIVEEFGNNKPFLPKEYNDEEEKMVKENPNLKSINEYPNYTNSVILFRSTYQIDEIIKAFEKRNIPYIIEKEVDSSLTNSYPFKSYFDDIFSLFKSNKTKKDWDKFMLALAQKTYINENALKDCNIIKQYTENTKGKLFDLDALIAFVNNNKLLYELPHNEKDCLKGYIEVVERICNGQLVKPLELISIIKRFGKEKNNVDKWKDVECDAAAYATFIEIISELEQIKKDKKRKNEFEIKKNLYDDNKFNGVYLLTIHKSKGLAFENVFIVGCSENSFPSKRAVTEDSINMIRCQEKAEPPTTIEEERRLMYVALTRAKKKAVITCPLDGGNSPSVFVEEIKEKLG